MTSNNQVWETKTIGDFVSVKRGYDLTSKQRNAGTIPVYGAAGQNGVHNEIKAKAPGIVIGRSGGSFGKVHFVSKDFWPHNTAMYVTDFKGNDPDFSYYLLKLLDFSALNSGSAQPSLNRNYLYPVKIKAPTPSVQRVIGKILKNLDEKIELTNKINIELEAMAKLIYDYWFVQFDFPDVNGKPYKSSGGKMVYNEELKREIPDGWAVNLLADWIDTDKTGDWGKETEQGNYTLQVDCIRGADINGLNGKGKVKAPNRFILQKNQHKLLLPYDLIIEISGGSPIQSTGRMAFLTPEIFDRFSHPMICSNFCKAISLKNKSYFYNFVYQWNAIYDNGILFGWEGKTSGIKNLLFDSFISKHNVCVPPEALVNSFSKIIEPIQQKKQKSLKENSKLEKLRDWLLPMLMNGQVNVKDA